MKPNHDEFEAGTTADLSLRVSVATLVRVLFEDPRDGELTLALERKATLFKAEGGPAIEVIAQPFGGAIRILDLRKLRDRIGDFHFDSEESRSEQDFRIFIRPSDWSVVQEFCIQHFSRVDDSILESAPTRELAEEFADALKISLKPDQYTLKPVRTVVEDHPTPTENIHAKGYPTARVYRIFEARILDASLSHAILMNSERYSNHNLQELALENARNGGKGRANAILAFPLKLISDAYLGMPPEARNTSFLLEDNYLDESVAAILEGVSAQRYRRVEGK
jgi:hypothetical protein